VISKNFGEKSAYPHTCFFKPNRQNPENRGKKRGKKAGQKRGFGGPARAMKKKTRKPSKRSIRTGLERGFWSFWTFFDRMDVWMNVLDDWMFGCPIEVSIGLYCILYSRLPTETIANRFFNI
jgi:hypothetical protein